MDIDLINQIQLHCGPSKLGSILGFDIYEDDRDQHTIRLVDMSSVYKASDTKRTCVMQSNKFRYPTLVAAFRVPIPHRMSLAHIKCGAAYIAYERVRRIDWTLLDRPVKLYDNNSTHSVLMHPWQDEAVKSFYSTYNRRFFL